MKYNLRDQFQRNQFAARTQLLLDKADCVVDLTEKRGKTISQNNFAHLAIAYFGTQIGETMEYCKRQYFKLTCNPDIFVRQKEDKIFHEVRPYLRSFADLTKEETTLAIDRFMIWASQEAGVYIPNPDDFYMVQQMELEVERQKRFL